MRENVLKIRKKKCKFRLCLGRPVSAAHRADQPPPRGAAQAVRGQRLGRRKVKRASFLGRLSGSLLSFESVSGETEKILMLGSK